MTLEPVCRDVETAQGVPITVTGVAQVRIDEILKLGQIYLGKYKNWACYLFREKLRYFSPKIFHYRSN